MANPALLAAYDFSGIGALVDVGGGHGAFLAAILAASPTMRGVLFDRPSVVDAARDRIEAAGVEARYAIKNVLLDHNDADVRAILQHCRRAVARDGRLLVIEALIPPGDQPSPAKFLDLVKLMDDPGARCRTATEFGMLFQFAGFELTRVTSPASPASILEAAPTEAH